MDKQEQILQAALPLFVQYGFHGTPTSRIAQQAGVSNGTLFHYFKTKEELVIALYNRLKTDLGQYLSAQADAGASVETQFRTLFFRSLYWALDNQQAFFYIQQVNFSPHVAHLSAEAVLEQTRDHRRLIERGIAEGVLKPLSVDLIYTMVMSQIFGLYQYLSSQPMTTAKRHEVVQQSADLLWDMLS
ncbi:MAG: TetR/AcrR family transcriptional regulator [Bacteroidetes bacterium]|nr:TetR/AcrR family transcriptional regulator [Fibrella sp.]